MRYLICFLTHPLTAIVALQLYIIALLTALVVKHTVGKVMNPQLVAQLPLELQAAIAAFEAYAVPAAQAIHNAAEAQAHHDREMQQNLLAVISGLPTEQQASLLLGLQSNEIDGNIKIIESVFAGYTGLITACARGAVAFNMTERTPESDLAKLNLFI